MRSPVTLLTPVILCALQELQARGWDRPAAVRCGRSVCGDSALRGAACSAPRRCSSAR